MAKDKKYAEKVETTTKTETGPGRRAEDQGAAVKKTTVKSEGKREEEE